MTMPRSILVMAVLAGCGHKGPAVDDCRDKAHAAATPKLDTVHACASLYTGACRDALAGVTTVALDTQAKVVAACRRAYPKLDPKLPPDQVFAHALDGTPRLHETDLAAIGAAIEVELRPPAVTIRLTSTSIAIDHGKTYEVAEAATPESVQPAVDDIFARGGNTGGVIIWGRYEAPQVFEAVMPALRDVPTVICQRDGANCR
jgi:hypothetical protein